MDIKAFLEALTPDAAGDLETHFVEQFLRDTAIADLRSSRYDEDREWATGVEEYLIEQWGAIEGI